VKNSVWSMFYYVQQANTQGRVDRSTDYQLRVYSMLIHVGWYEETFAI
jgi:hypothetical protein